LTAVIAHAKTIEFETFGNADNPSVLLIMGLGSPLASWRLELRSAVADESFYTIR
jgi:pimeloyl-ACP methyl ester carboxylesterase